MNIYYRGTTHGSWCNTKTRPMRCQHCQEKIFYFTCDCGCKVLFDELGDPWPRHYCEEYHKHISKVSKSRVHARLSFIKSRLHRHSETIFIEASDVNQNGLVLQFDKPLDKNNSDAYIREEESVNLNWGAVIYGSTIELHRGDREDIRKGRTYLVVVNASAHDGKQHIKKHVRFTTISRKHPSIEIIH